MLLINLKWFSTLFVLMGILLTNLNIYPYNILIHGIGVTGWSLWAYLKKDNAILVNFSFQIPLFLIGYINYIM